MHYAPRILLCCTAWMSVFVLCLAEEPFGPALIVKNITKDVETVLSPSLIGELQGAQSNRSAVNVEQTAPRVPEQPRSINDKKPEIKIDSQVHPYHYERSYHYQYPPPHGDPSRPVGYSETFYEPHYRPRGYDPSYYRSELYNPFGSSRNSPNPRLESKSQATGSSNDNADIDRDVRPTENSGSSEVVGRPTPLPPRAFEHPDILKSPPPPPLSSVDFGSYRPSVFSRPLVHHYYYRPSGDGGSPQKDPPGYLPKGEARSSESFPQRPVEPYPPLPPLDSFQNYPRKEFQGYDEGRRPENLPPPFSRSFFPPGYQSPFYSSYRPSDHFHNLFSDNFTRSFPSRPYFGGFYPNDYPPPPPAAYPTPAEGKPVEPVPPAGEASSQPIPTSKPGDVSAPEVAASNSHYVKLFFQPRDDVNSKELEYIGSYRLY